MPTAQFLLGKISSGKFAIPPWDMMVKYPPPPQDRVNKHYEAFSLYSILPV